MLREPGNEDSSIWLIGDSSLPKWGEYLDEPLDSRHPARHDIWTTVLEGIQKQVFLGDCRGIVPGFYPPGWPCAKFRNPGPVAEIHSARSSEGASGSEDVPCHKSDRLRCQDDRHGRYGPGNVASAMPTVTAWNVSRHVSSLLGNISRQTGRPTPMAYTRIKMPIPRGPLRPGSLFRSWDRLRGTEVVCSASYCSSFRYFPGCAGA